MAAREAALEAARAKVADAAARIWSQSAEIEARRGELADRDRRIGELEQVAGVLSRRVVDRERELRDVRALLDRAGAERDEGMHALEAAVRELEQVRRQARGQATRMRLQALREAAELVDRVAEVSRRPAEVRERLLEPLAEAIGRIGVEVEPEPVNGDRPARAADLFEGLVEIEIGPLSDFSQLVGFEDAAKAITATSEISVKRFSEGRATLAMTLKEPVELLHELESRCGLEFRVRDQRDGRLVLDVGDEA